MPPMRVLCVGTGGESSARRGCRIRRQESDELDRAGYEMTGEMLIDLGVHNTGVDGWCGGTPMRPTLRSVVFRSVQVQSLRFQSYTTVFVALVRVDTVALNPARNSPSRSLVQVDVPIRGIRPRASRRRCRLTRGGGGVSLSVPRRRVVSRARPNPRGARRRPAGPRRIVARATGRRRCARARG